MADINNFIDPKLLDSLVKINEQLIITGNTIDKLIPTLKSFEEVQSKIGKETKDGAESRKKLTAAQKEAARIDKQLIKDEQKLISLQNGLQDELLETKDALQKETKAKKDNLKASQAAEGSLVRMRKKLSELTAAYDRSGKRTKAAATEIRKLSEQIGKAEAATNRHQRGVGGYGKAIKKVALQLAGALGLTSALFIFVNVLKGSFNTIREFTKENAVLAGVLGVTRKEIKELTEQAINLGSEYPITASEVNKLQVSFARLGFTQEEIINLTEATIQGSIALNSSLDQTATLVGAVVLAFQNLGTENATEIIDKLTLSTQRSSLSFASLETGIPKVAGAANALSISLSKTLSHLGTAHDATLDASVAATSLRNIYLELSKRGITLDEALNLINTSSSKLNTSFELFGKRGAIVGLALANNIEKTNDLEGALDNAGGTAERVAKEQMATLDGAIKGLDSSWEKLILRMKGSEGVFSAVVNGFSNMLDVMTDKSTSFGDVILTLFGGNGAAIVRAERSARKVMFDVIEKSNEEQLNAIIDANRDRVDEGEELAKEITIAAKNRIVILAKAESDGRKREELARQNAALQQLAISKESEAEITANNKKESDIRIKTWVDETVSRAEEKQKQIDEQKQLEKEFSEEIAKDIEKNDEKIKVTKITQIKEVVDNTAEIEQQQREATKEASIQGAAELGNTLFGLKTASLQREFEAAEGNAEKQAEISRRIAQQEKKQALFNIAINTATAIVKALPNIPLSIIVGGLGLIQGGVVAKTPIPSFATGTDYAPGGVTELAERGHERVINPDGTIWTAQNRGLYNLAQGSKVLTNTQTTKEELNDKRIVSELRLTRKAIQNQPRQRNESVFAARQRGYRDGYFMSKNRLN